MPIYTFDIFEYDPDNHELKANGERVDIQPRTLEILDFFVRSSEKIIKKQELLKTFVNEDNLRHQVRNLRAKLSSKKVGEYIETIPSVGYKFLVEVQAKKQPSLLKNTKFLVNNIPFVTDGFIGRRNEIENFFNLINLGYSGYVFWGMPGVGKTHLSLALIDRIKDEFEALIYVDLRGLDKPLSAIDVMHTIVKFLSKEKSKNLKDSEIVAYYHTLLNEHKTLLFLDNALGEFQFSNLKNNNCFLIVTSREKLLINGGRSVLVDVLSGNDARDLLFSIAKKRYFKGKEQTLAELVGNLPLALKPLASLLEKRLIDIEDLIEEFKLKRNALELEVFDLIKPSEIDLTIRTVFALSEKFLDEKLKEFWYEMGIFPSDFSVEAAAYVTSETTPISKKNLRNLTSKSLTQLLELNLLEQNQTIELERYRLHDLIRDYAREKIDDDKFSSLEREFATYYGQLITQFNKPTPEILAKFDIERVNLETGFDWVKKQNESEKAITELCLAYTSYSSNVLFLRLRIQECIEWLEKGLSAARAIGNRHFEVARLSNLGSAYWYLADYHKAREYYEKSFSISLKTNDSEGISKNSGNLGSVHTMLGDYQKSADYYEQSLAINTEIDNKTGIASDLGNLGNLYRILGDPIKAISYYEQTLVYAEDQNDFQFRASSLGNLGLIYSEIGKYQKAIEYYNRCFEITEILKDKRIEATHRIGLGIVFKNLGEFQKAENEHKRALKLAKEVGDKSNIGYVLGHLGVVYKNLNNFNKAIEHYEKALLIAQEIGDKRGESNHLGNLGIAYKNLEKYEKAKYYYAEAINISKEIGDKRSLGNWLGNLGNVYKITDNHLRAEDLYKQALDLAKETKDIKGEANWLGNLSDVYKFAGEKEKAVQLLKKAIAIFDAIKSPDAQIYRDSLAEIELQ